MSEEESSFDYDFDEIDENEIDPSLKKILDKYEGQKTKQRQIKRGYNIYEKIRDIRSISKTYKPKEAYETFKFINDFSFKDLNTFLEEKAKDNKDFKKRLKYNFKLLNNDEITMDDFEE